MPEPHQPENGGSRPVPDPTKLTTDAVEAAKAQIRLDTKALEDKIEARLDGMDKATELRLAALDHIAFEIEEHVGAARSVLEEKIVGVTGLLDEKILSKEALTTERFESVGLQFKERDTRSEREARDNTKAVDAAFAAQKDQASEQNRSNQLSIDKSEKATNEAIGKNADLFATSSRALEDKLGDLARRFERLESSGLGAASGSDRANIAAEQAKVANTRLIMTAIIIIGTLISLGGFIIALIATGK